ncbi:hypothetical protein BSKO_08952 [Bryopsis sp. KO-2023]|nr:hypothetical protein BSKO_08952 [Bryopsis sp. KO-2023]
MRSKLSPLPQTKEEIKKSLNDGENSALDPSEEEDGKPPNDETMERAQRVARELHDRYEKQVQRWIDYRNLFVFIGFVALFLAVLYLQRNAQTAYQVHSTLSTILPTTLFMDTPLSVLKWIKLLLKNVWKDPACGDGICETPFEFASYGRFGCRADCGKLSEMQNLTTVQIDLIFNFDHPVTSISSADLMTQASWNLCPKNGAPHGKDCYYASDQIFESLKGEVHVTIDDVPDGEWQVFIKRDFFNKVRGAVRIVEKVKEQADWDRKYGAYLAARADQEFELRVLNEAIAMSNVTAYQFTVDKLVSGFNDQYNANQQQFLDNSLNETAYADANATVDAEKTFILGQYEKATCRCDDLGVVIEFEEDCKGVAGTLSQEDVEGVTLTETEVCERYKNMTDQSIADRLVGVQDKLTYERLGSRGINGKVGARAAKKTELKDYINAAKPEVYDSVFITPTGQSPEKDVNFTETKFDTLAKYFSDGPTGYMDPAALTAQLSLATREVRNSTLDELRERSQSRTEEIYEQQQEIEEIDVIQEMIGKYSAVDANFTKDPVPTFVAYNYVTWSGSSVEYLVCDLEARAPKYMGECQPSVVCTRDDDTSPYTCPNRPELLAEECDIWCNRQEDCNAICQCTSTGGECSSDEYCKCEICEDLQVAEEENEFRTIEDIATSGGSSSGSLVGRRRARRLQSDNRTEEQLDELLEGVKVLRSGQDGLKEQVESLESEVETANSLSEERAKDTSLQQLIQQGRQEIATGQERVETMLDEILGKQNEALAAAQEAQKTVAALEALAVKAAQAQADIDRAVREQLNAIKIASQQNLISLDQALELYKRARRDRLLAERKAELANRRCTSQMVVHQDFEVDNYEEEDIQTSRERHIGLTNRVIAGLLLHTSRTKPVKCSDSRFTAIENECSGGLSAQSYGVDPAFKLGTSLFNADIDNEESMVVYYNCSELNVATYDLQDPYSKYERFVNQEPFCAELFSIRDIPYGFRAFDLEGKSIGFPVFFDINLSEGEAKRWYSYIDEGLFLDGDTRTVTAEMVTYNAELMIFGFVRVSFTFTDGGSIKVTHKLHTLKVELYETPQDFARLALEILWTGAVFLWLIVDVYNINRRRTEKGSFFKAFTSLWVWTDLVSNVLMTIAVIMWWTFVVNYADPFNIDLRYDVYASLNPQAAYLKLQDRGAGLVAMHNDFKSMQELVDTLAWYYALNGINILLLIARLLKRMDFQPRLGVVTRSLALAGPDLIHFSLVSGMVFIGYAMMAHLIFGNAIQGFSTFSKSVNTCFEILLGEIGVNDELKALSGLQALAGTLFFWSFELLVFMVLLNFLLAIIVDAFSEVKENTSDMTGMHTELAQMIKVKWQNFRGWLTNKNHVPESKMGQMLKLWAGDSSEEEPLIKTEIFDEKKLKILGEEIDTEALKEILNQCLVDVPPPSMTRSLLSFGRVKPTHEVPTQMELNRAAEYVIERFGHLPGEDEDEDGEDGEGEGEEKEGKSSSKIDGLSDETAEQLELEREKLARALERLAEVQRELAEGQRNIMVGQKQLVQQQGKLVNLLGQQPPPRS